MPKARFSLLFVAVLAVVLATAPAAPAADLAMVKDLVGLGVTPQQAAGGAKALFDLAKTNLGADDFAKLAQSVPDVASLMGAAGDTAKTASTAASTAATATADSAASAAKTETAAAGAEAKQATAKAESTASSAATALLAAAAGAGGGLGDLGKLTGNAGLISKFAELGLKPEMIAKFAPVLFKNTLSSGGPAAAQLLKKGLGL
jgi:hypothetical protein